MRKKDVILVVDRKNLFGGNFFDGFRHFNVVDYEKRILNNLRSIQRKKAEYDLSIKQLIAYPIIINSNSKEIFTYRRFSPDPSYAKVDLGMWSWGVWSHIKKTVNKNNPVHWGVLRNLENLGYWKEGDNFNLIGYINDESDKIGKHHFGIIYTIETGSNKVGNKDSRIRGRFMPIEKLEEICSISELEVEKWSRLTLNPLSDYLKSF